MKKLSPAQWLRLDPSRKPQPQTFTPSAPPNGDIIRTVNGSNLRRAA